MAECRHGGLRTSGPCCFLAFSSAILSLLVTFHSQKVALGAPTSELNDIRKRGAAFSPLHLFLFGRKAFLWTPSTHSPLPTFSQSQWSGLRFVPITAEEIELPLWLTNHKGYLLLGVGDSLCSQGHSIPEQNWGSVCKEGRMCHSTWRPLMERQKARTPHVTTPRVSGPWGTNKMSKLMGVS